MLSCVYDHNTVTAYTVYHIFCAIISLEEERFIPVLTFILILMDWFI